MMNEAQVGQATKKDSVSCPFFLVEHSELLSEPHHRGIGFGIALHSNDNWVQAVPAGGPSGTRTPDQPVMSR